MNENDALTDGTQPSGLFGVFSAIEKRPVIRAWASSRPAAEARLAELRSADRADAREEDEYYVVSLTRGDVASYKQGGFIPEEA
jgi:hypothetical protein